MRGFMPVYAVDDAFISTFTLTALTLVFVCIILGNSLL